MYKFLIKKMNKKKYFRGQKEDELVLAVFHKHWISFVKPILLFLPFFIVSLVVLFYQQNIGNGFLLFGFIIFLASVTYLSHNFLIWWWDVYILTNKRVIDFDQKTLFHKVVSEADLNNIQDTTYEIKGLWQTIFNYGKVNILTASTGDNIDFEDVSHPQNVQDMIGAAKDRMMGEIGINDGLGDGVVEKVEEKEV